MEEINTGIFIITNNNPIYVIGDIHGDYQCLIHCLIDLCKTCYIHTIGPDKKFNEEQREYIQWKPNNNSIVIFCGDLIHRKRFQDTVLDDECSDIFIIKTLLRLKKTAQKYKGDIIIISGNHEIMNILDPFESNYTSNKNLEVNIKYFSDQLFVNNYINNTYAWIKINDILIAHGGLCSDYLKFLEDENEFKKDKQNSCKKNIMIGGDILKFGNDIIQFINDKYRSFFTDYNIKKTGLDPIGSKLFIEYDQNKHKHNMFWCREWGYSGIDCEKLNNIIKKVGCNKMIIAHCPQFLTNDKPKMINFECLDSNSSNLVEQYKIARIDLGMSRSFEYNKQNNEFLEYLSYNYNRKMSILKLSYDCKKKNFYFNYDSIITDKISCIQYLLIKYGINKDEWEKKNIETNWLGFEYIQNILKNLKENDNIKKCGNNQDLNDVILCLLYPIYYSKYDLDSVKQFSDFFL